MADTPEFKKVADSVRNLAKRPTDPEFSEMYSLYKQATVGDCNVARPAVTDPMGQAKFDAWTAKKGMSQADAAKKYIEVGNEAVKKYGVKTA